VVLLALAWSREGGALVRAGEDAPDFALQQLGGGQVSLSDFRGKVVLVNLFGFN
jgi:peroxiredoxin